LSTAVHGCGVHPAYGSSTAVQALSQPTGVSLAVHGTDGDVSENRPAIHAAKKTVAATKNAPTTHPKTPPVSADAGADAGAVAG
jgi:hypothetical protein